MEGCLDMSLVNVVRHTLPDNVHQLHVQTTFHIWKTRGCQCSFKLLMLGGVSPETCWASYKYGIIKFWYIVASSWISRYEFYCDARIHKRPALNVIITFQNLQTAQTWALTTLCPRLQYNLYLYTLYSILHNTVFILYLNSTLCNIFLDISPVYILLKIIPS